MKTLGIVLFIVAVSVGIFMYTNKANAPESDGENTGVEVADEKYNENIVILKTNKGDITVELDTENAPITTENFVKLAKEGFFDGTKFHRIIADFMIQGGDPLTKDDTQVSRWGTGGPGYVIPDEFTDTMHNVRGTLAMANAGPNTGGSQFFINLADRNTYLDGKHPVFGRVVDGMEVVDAIAKVAVNNRDVPNEPIVIETVIVPR